MKSNWSKYLSLILIFILLVSSNNGFSSSLRKTPKKVIIELITSKGSIVLQLYSKTVKHKENFIKLVKDGFYDGILFHRVIDGFMAQAGDPNSKNLNHTGPLGNESEGETIPAELYQEYYHKKGALAAARMGDKVNPLKASSGSQFYLVQGKVYTIEQLSKIEDRINAQKENKLIDDFFQLPENKRYLNRLNYCKQKGYHDSITILVKEVKPLIANNIIEFNYSEKAIQDYTTIGGTPFLDGGYTVYGEVIAGIEIIDEICAAKTKSGDRPIEDISIVSAKILKRKKCLKKYKR